MLRTLSPGPAPHPGHHCDPPPQNLRKEDIAQSNTLILSVAMEPGQSKEVPFGQGPPDIAARFHDTSFSMECGTDTPNYGQQTAFPTFHHW